MIDLMILLGVFAVGATAGFLVLLLVGSAHEDRWLRPEPPTRAAAAARRFTGLRVRMPEAGWQAEGRR
jgi:hypothetical protein